MEALDAVGAPELRDALLYIRSRRGPVCADELAAAQSVHPNVARRRLARLAEAGLLVCRLERRSGRSGPGAGRPARLYSPAPETSAIEFPARPYGELVGLLAAEVPEERLRAAGAELAETLLGDAAPEEDLRSGLERVCAAVGRLGFQASLEEVAGDRALIATPTCPLRPLVVTRPETAAIDRGLWCGLVAAAVAGVTIDDVECETRDCLDGHVSCRVVLTLKCRQEARTD
jgi:predicted ArsR family transcriptional regulator